MRKPDKTRPQWLTVSLEDGQKMHMRLPANPSVQDVRGFLDKLNTLANRMAQRHGQLMLAASSKAKHAVGSGWSLTQGPARARN